ncbi:hypothetical protein DINM_006457 [Dirofilaria immitis]|nr:hypothetical protein [Dirofilaria immitis]
MPQHIFSRCLHDFDVACCCYHLVRPLFDSKKPLLNEDEIRKMKEEETKKVASGSAQMSFNLAGDELDRSFEHILNNSAVPRTVPAVIRTKKAENRLVACSASPTLSGEPLNSVEQRAMEHQKRQEWRQARFKSLEADSKAAEEVMQQVEQINNRLANITEEHNNSSLPINEKILQNETSFERNEYIDPVTGAATVSLVEKASLRESPYDPEYRYLNLNRFLDVALFIVLNISDNSFLAFIGQSCKIHRLCKHRLNDNEDLFFYKTELVCYASVASTFSEIDKDLKLSLKPSHHHLLYLNISRETYRISEMCALSCKTPNLRSKMNKQLPVLFSDLLDIQMETNEDELNNNKPLMKEYS